jgi:hypothetical protein
VNGTLLAADFFLSGNQGLPPGTSGKQIVA